MDYLEIVLQGYFNENDREFLEKYFIREYKQAEKEHFVESDVFFNGCLKVIKNWEKYLETQVNERKNELYLMLAGAKDGTLTYSDMEGKTIEQKRLETIEYCEKELKDVHPYGIGSISFTVHLNSLTRGRYSYHMTYDEVQQIKLSITKAFEKAQSSIETLPTQVNKATVLKNHLSQFGFFEIEKVKQLSEQGKISLIENISNNGLPYAIAMFDYLLFIRFLVDNYCKSKKELYKKISIWFDSDKDGRAVKGNLKTLSEYSNENRKRYTAHIHKEQVIKDYEHLK